MKRRTSASLHSLFQLLDGVAFCQPRSNLHLPLPGQLCVGVAGPRFPILKHGPYPGLSHNRAVTGRGSLGLPVWFRHGPVFSFPFLISSFYPLIYTQARLFRARSLLVASGSHPVPVFLRNFTAHPGLFMARSHLFTARSHLFMARSHLFMAAFYIFMTVFCLFMARLLLFTAWLCFFTAGPIIIIIISILITIASG